GEGRAVTGGGLRGDVGAVVDDGMAVAASGVVDALCERLAGGRIGVGPDVAGRVDVAVAVEAARRHADRDGEVVADGAGIHVAVAAHVRVVVAVGVDALGDGLRIDRLGQGLDRGAFAVDVGPGTGIVDAGGARVVGVRIGRGVDVAVDRAGGDVAACAAA